MVKIKHWLSTIEIIDTEPRIQYSPNYRIDIVPKAESQYSTSLPYIIIIIMYGLFNLCSLFVVCNPPDPNDLNFGATVDRIANEINIHFITAGYGNTELSKFGQYLLDTQDQNNRLRLMSIIQSDNDVKGKLVKILNFWAIKRGSVWENVIGTLEQIGLGKISGDLADELKSNQECSAKGNFVLT